MEIWRVENEGGARPAVMSGGNLVCALVLHVLLFVLFFVYACVKGLFDKAPEDPIQFIDPTVVVNENLDGVENELPPVQDPEEPPPPPPPPPKPVEKNVEPPKELEKIVTNIVKKVEKKEEKKEEKVEKKEKPKEPEKPKKTAKELREERMKKMRESAKTVKGKTVTIKVDAPSGNGRTDKKTLTDAQIRDLLNKGYRPGASTNLAANEEQLGYSLIKRAFEEKWDQPPWTDTMKPMTIRVWFGGGGRIIRYQLEASSGDARADQSIKSAASRVGAVSALPTAFIDKYKTSGVPIRFTVKPK